VAGTGAQHGGEEPAGVDPRGFEADRALSRLEDLLAGLPFDRALPDLAGLLTRAEVPVDLLPRDERFLKVLHEATVARPFGTVDEVVRTRTELELCTLEVEVLTDRLVEHADDPGAREPVVQRLAVIRARLDEVRARL
jgi:hypothetical protein